MSKSSWRRAGLLVAGAFVGILLVALPIGAAPPPQSVKVINTAAEPVPVAAQFEPVQSAAVIALGAGERQKTANLYTVPAGKRLVVENASAQGQLEAGTAAATVNLLAIGPGIGIAYVPLTAYGFFDGQGEMLVGNEPVRIYVDPGQTLTVRVVLNTSTGTGGRFEVSFTGYLVDLP